MKESSLQNSVLKFLNALEGCIAENVSGNSQQSGRPDVNGCYRGKSFRIELKVLGNKPTKKQIINLSKWLKAGSAICVAYCLDDVKKFIMGMDYNFSWQTIRGSYAAFALYINGVSSDEFIKQYKQLYIQD